MKYTPKGKNYLKVAANVTTPPSLGLGSFVEYALEDDKLCINNLILLHYWLPAPHAADLAL